MVKQYYRGFLNDLIYFLLFNVFCKNLDEFYVIFVIFKFLSFSRYTQLRSLFYNLLQS